MKKENKGKNTISVNNRIITTKLLNEEKRDSMNILVIARPIDNAGDWLIADRLVSLVTKTAKEISPTSHVEFKNALSVNDVDYYNSFDSIVIGGGPIADNTLLGSDSFDVMAKLSQITTPVSLIGVGWYGPTTSSKDMFAYRVVPDLKDKLCMIIQSGGVIGVRDITTQYVLASNGIDSIVSGCPVWYPEDSSPSHLSGNIALDPKKIVISNAGITKDSSVHEAVAHQTQLLVNSLQILFPRAELLFTFNGGIDTKYSAPCNRAIADFLYEKNISYYDISGSATGFNLYDDADLHVGYRLHSHLYCLSKGIPSLLIEEDARGGGANVTLGTPRVTAYDSLKHTQPNPYFEKELETVLKEYQTSGYLAFINALERVNLYLPVMKNVIKKALLA